MMGKLKWVVAFGAGYLLGTRSGRARYDQIAAKAQQLWGELWGDPRVQKRAGQAQQALREKADQARQAFKEKVGDMGSGDGTPGSSTSSVASTSGGRP